MPINTILLNKVYPDTPSADLESLEIMPTTYKRDLTRDDVLNGSFTRYFIRPVNDKNYVVEVSVDDYEELRKNPRFVSAKINWVVVGKKETIQRSPGVSIYGVEDTNRRVVSEADLTFGGLRRYITNYLEYWFAERL